MPMTQTLSDFKISVSQCDGLIANAHKLDASGMPIFSALDRQQITVAAFLNMFIAWESFLEASLSHLMIGSSTLSGSIPIKYVAPSNALTARQLVIGVGRHFDYGNHDHVRKIVNIYFDAGYPYEPHISAILSDLNDIKTIRNASAHITSTTQTALESLALRVFGSPRPSISLYDLLTTVDPRSSTGETIFSNYKNKLTTTAELISKG